MRTLLPFLVRWLFTNPPPSGIALSRSPRPASSAHCPLEDLPGTRIIPADRIFSSYLSKPSVVWREHLFFVKPHTAIAWQRPRELEGPDQRSRGAYPVTNAASNA